MIDWRIERLDSPIQAMLGEALAHALAYYIPRPEHVQIRAELPIALSSRNIRADFAIIVTDEHAEQRARLIVEADGAAFHDASRDAERDAAALECGWSTLRFTGSDINANTEECAREVACALERLVWPPKPVVAPELDGPGKLILAAFARGDEATALRLMQERDVAFRDAARRAGVM